MRRFYKRLVDALDTEEERRAFSDQVELARIEPFDAEHDRFTLPDDVPGIEPWGHGHIIDAIYEDADGADVNVLVHCVRGRVSSAERYRNLGEPIITWPPPDDTTLQFPRYG